MPCEHCGKEVYIYKARQKGFKYCSRRCHGKAVLSKPEVQAKITRKYGKDHPRWKGGTINKERGYRLICVRGKQVYEHRYIMEQYIGRKLESRENVHHLDGDKLNNNIENLEVIDVADHIRECHNRQREDGKWHITKCPRCKKDFESRITDYRKFCSKKCHYNH